MTYETAYQDEVKRSRILGGNRDADALHGASVDLSTRAKVERLIEEYERAEGHIEAAQTAVDSIEAEYSKLQTQRHALGWPTPASMPPDMNDRYNRAKAKLGVLKAERDRLKEMLGTWQEEEEADRSGDILRQLGNMRITTDNDPVVGRRTAVDGQRLSLADEQGRILDQRFNPRSTEALEQIPAGAFAIIDDPFSPFDGASLATYREIVEYIKREREQRKQALLAENAARPLDERVPESQLVDRARRWRTSPWPPAWPADSRNWKRQERESA